MNYAKASIIGLEGHSYDLVPLFNEPRFNVLHMFAPRDTDLLLGATKQRQLVIWQHNKMGAYRAFKKHEDWVESLIVVNTTVNGQHCEEIFSAGADGIVLRWQLDSEQNCDIYQCIVGP
jgi:WD40 repeat protein